MATVLNAIDSEGEIPDTGDFAKQHGVDHKALTGVALSLESIGFILKQVHGYNYRIAKMVWDNWSDTRPLA